MEALLWKIKSHTDIINIRDNYMYSKPVVQPYNGEADRLADLGRLHPNNEAGIPISLNNLNNSYYYEKTVCLNGSNNINIVRQFWLRTISESRWKPD